MVWKTWGPRVGQGRAPRSKRGKYVVKTQERDHLAPFTPQKSGSGPIFLKPFTRITIRLGLWLKRALMHTVYTADFWCPDQIFIWAFGIFPYRSVVNTQKGARRKETWLLLWLPLFYHFLFGAEWLPFKGKTPQKHWTVLEENGEGKFLSGQFF